jgi:hypothetical protein
MGVETVSLVMGTARLREQKRHLRSPPGGIINKRFHECQRVIAAGRRRLGTHGADAADAHGASMQDSRQTIPFGTREDVVPFGQSV